MSNILLGRFLSLAKYTAKRGWDTYGHADPIQEELWLLAQSIAESMATEVSGISDAFPSPGESGGVNLRWTNPTKDHRRVDVEVMSDTCMYWHQRKWNAYSEGEFNSQDELLVHLRRFMTDSLE